MVTDSENSASKVEDEWGAATWATLERAQLTAALAAAPAPRLAWLEEAMRLAHASGALLVQSRIQAEPQTSKHD